MSIPKIIHHTAPTNRDHWNPVWEKCYESWKEHHDPSEYEFRMWNDEDIDNLVKEKYPHFFEIYQSFPLHILKIDFARACMIHQYGGIYVDMDIYCYSNFWDDFQEEVILVGALAEDEVIQNSFFGGEKDSSFYVLYMSQMISEFKNSPNFGEFLNNAPPNVEQNILVSYYVKQITGPYCLSQTIDFFNKDKLQILPKEEYNPPPNFYDKSIKMKHMLTGDWGSEGRDNYDDTYLSWKDFKKLGYFQGKGIDIDTFDFRGEN